MTDDPAARALIGRIDCRAARPGPAPRSRLVDRPKVSESGGFIDRSPRATRRHLTGRNHQFNAKATADTIRRFNAICDGQRWVAGLALEHLVALGEAALRRGTIAEAISALERAGGKPQRARHAKPARGVGHSWLVGETLERAVMSALTSRAMPDDLARLYVLEATIEILKTENEILKRRLAAAETWAAQAVITKRLDTLAANRLDGGAAERARQAVVAAPGGLRKVKRAGGETRIES